MTLKQKLMKKLAETLDKKGATGFSGLYSGFISSRIAGIDISHVRISVDALFTSWRNHGDVYGCVRKLQQNIGSSGYKWVSRNDPDADPDMGEVVKAEKALNFNRTFRTWKNLAIRDNQVTGNAYFHIEKSKGNGSPLSLERLDPRTLSAVVDKYGNVIKWIQRVQADTQEFSPEEVVQWKTEEDPNNPVYGLSPLETIIWEVRTDLGALINNYVFFINDATPGALYIMEEGMSDEQTEKAIRLIQEQHKGAENKHKGLVMSGVKEVKTLSVSQKDMEFHVLRKFTTEKICAAFGVPKSVLGYVDNVNLANGREQTEQFWDGTVQPLQESLEEFINEMILPRLGITKIRIKFKPREFDDKEWDEASSRADVQLGIMTINQARQKRGMKPFDPVEHGEFVDKPMIYNGLAVTPLEDIALDTGEDVPTIDSEDAAQKEIRRLQKMRDALNYGQARTHN